MKRVWQAYQFLLDNLWILLGTLGVWAFASVIRCLFF
jgi:hypothetical protein